MMAPQISQINLWETPDVVDGVQALFEQRQPVRFVNGKFSVMLGEGQPGLSEVIFDGDALYVGVAVGATTLAGRQRIVPVPYADGARPDGRGQRHSRRYGGPPRAGNDRRGGDCKRPLYRREKHFYRHRRRGPREDVYRAPGLHSPKPCWRMLRLEVGT